MFSNILTHLRPNVRLLENVINLRTKFSKRFISSNFKENNLINCIKTNEYLSFNPLILNDIEINEKLRKSDPILDKFDSNNKYILFNSLNINSKQNAIILPNLKTFRDLDTNNKKIIDWENENKPYKEMPSANKNADKLYLDYRIIRDPRAYTHLTIIRRRKMNKHKRLKWRKKMLAFIKKKYLKRNIKKEKLFRAELLSKIKEAEEFDAQKYVHTILQTIDNVPKEETPKEKIERIRELIRKNRRETNLIEPKFYD